jgi:hypothetical protein
MLYRIEYFVDEARIGSVPWSGTLFDTIMVAKDGLIRHGATGAIIVDPQGEVVWSGAR